MICSNCGTENEAGRKFCIECAARLAAPCPNCGTLNPPAAKFCGECATQLTEQAAGGPNAAPAPSPPAVAPTAERRLVSVLFADLVGFTPFAEGRDAEEVRETLSHYFEIASDVIGRYGGTVEKFIGDAVMAVWGAPISPRGRCRAGRPGRPRARRRGAVARPHDPGAGGRSSPARRR